MRITNLLAYCRLEVIERILEVVERVASFTRSVRVYLLVAMVLSKDVSNAGKKMMERLAVPCVCDESATIEERCGKIAPLLLEACNFFKAGGNIGGSEAFATSGLVGGLHKDVCLF